MDNKFLIKDILSSNPSIEPFTIDFAISEKDLFSFNDDISFENVLDSIQKLHIIPAQETIVFRSNEGKEDFTGTYLYHSRLFEESLKAGELGRTWPIDVPGVADGCKITLHTSLPFAVGMTTDDVRVSEQTISVPSRKPISDIIISSRRTKP